MGTSDPRLTAQGKIDFRLQRQLRAYKKEDPPPNRVKPIPVTVLLHVVAVAVVSDSPASLAITDMIALDFFFLLWPGKYTGSASDTCPFRLADVQLFAGPRRLPLATAPAEHLLSATFATLEFTEQKNGVRGEVIGLARSGNPQFCPVICMARRVLHLRQHAAPAAVPLASYYTPSGFKSIKPNDITAVLKLAVNVMGPALGFLSQEISARSLRAAGAMALLCAHVDSDLIRLLGRWRSDEMLRYLHVQAEPVMRNFSALMIQGGTFALLPNRQVPLH